MDRRQRRTHAAIFTAFEALLEEKDYNSITVQNIIDRADIGRTTFYAHFETKDDLLQALCDRLFGHIVASAADAAHTHGQPPEGAAPESVFCHLLQHLNSNDEHALALLSTDRSGVFRKAFKESLMDLVCSQVIAAHPLPDVPDEFAVNHIAGGFVDMVFWWIQNGRRETPEELDRYFRAVNAALQ